MLAGEPLQQRDQGDDEEEEDDDLDVMMSSPAVAGWTRAQKRVGAEREEVGRVFFFFFVNQGRMEK